MSIRFQVSAKIKRPVHEVFNAVCDPRELTQYFTTGGATGPLTPGTTVTWEFADFPGAFPVQVHEVIPDKAITLSWNSGDGDYDTRIEMTFEALDADTTHVRVAESGWQETESGRKTSYGNCEGWTQMLCCLKAYREHGINLRANYY